MTLKKCVQLFICILIPLSIGALGGIATSSSISDWYLTLNRPSFNPPNYLFGPVWSFLYILMGISFYMIWIAPKTAKRTRAIFIFSIQLLLNFSWSFLFFYFHWIGIALIEIILIWLSIIWMIRAFGKLNKKAALLQIPYLLWVSFASLLNASYWFLN